MAAAKPDEWSYAASLTVAAEAAGLPKTARTRLRVLAALAGQLNLVEDPAAIRVSDVMVKAASRTARSTATSPTRTRRWKTCRINSCHS